ncbi:MAG TPA: class I SAM-dependent methyltransferase [Thermomicrobiales bacterium]|jgi:SAM-dependent methyltransferase
MASTSGHTVWRGTDGYEAYVGRWSRPLAELFLAWFAAPKGGRWLDVGCGTGALTAAVLAAADPIAVAGIDPSPEFLGAAQAAIPDPRARFAPGDARALPVASGGFDAVVAGLVLNFVPEPAAAVAEMARAARAGGAVGAYVWDYSGGLQITRYFWEAVAATDPAAAALDPSPRFAMAQPEPLAALFGAAALGDVVVTALDLPMVFRNLNDFWLPHTIAGASNAQRYVTALDNARKAALRERLRATLPLTADGSLRLTGRAWAVRGTKRAAGGGSSGPG